MPQYGEAPEQLSFYDFTLPEVMYYLYLPVKMPGTLTRLPQNVGGCLTMIREAMRHSARNGKDYEYTYLSARKGWASPDNPLNRPGWHCDGFGSDDMNYVWWKGPGTRFAVHDFGDISEDHFISARQFEERIDVNKVLTPQTGHLYAINPFVVHATPVIEPPGCMRQFIKISLSNERYNMADNSHNYLFNYDWAMHSRELIRNDPFKAQHDFVQEWTMIPENQETGTNPAPKPRKKAKKKVASKAVAIHKPAPPAAPVTLDQQIMLAAADPRVDVAKMKALTDLRRQLRMEEAKEAFWLAMAAAQEAMKPVQADADNNSKKYATLFAVDKALKPIYSKHGFSVSFNTADCPLPAHTRVLAYVSRGLYTKEYQYDVAIDAKGPKGNDVMNKTHAGGSALSYGKRYLLLMIFNVTINRGMDRDDDGNAAGGDHPISPDQLTKLIKLADDAGADKAKFCILMNVDSMAEIPASRFNEAHQQLERKLKKKAQSDFPGDR